MSCQNVAGGLTGPECSGHSPFYLIVLLVRLPCLGICRVDARGAGNEGLIGHEKAL